MVRESGYGNFEINVDIYFKGIKSKEPSKKTQLKYSLFLSPSLEALNSGKKKTSSVIILIHKEELLHFHTKILLSLTD